MSAAGANPHTHELAGVNPHIYELTGVSAAGVNPHRHELTGMSVADANPHTRELTGVSAAGVNPQTLELTGLSLVGANTHTHVNSQCKYCRCEPQKGKPRGSKEKPTMKFSSQASVPPALALPRFFPGLFLLWLPLVDDHAWHSLSTYFYILLREFVSSQHRSSRPTRQIDVWK